MSTLFSQYSFTEGPKPTPQDIALALITQVTHVRNKKVTFKGVT